MRNLVFGILVASTAILGFVAYQSGQKYAVASEELAAANEDVAAKSAALTALEAEKAALAEQVAALQTQVADLTKAGQMIDVDAWKLLNTALTKAGRASHLLRTAGDKASTR